MIEPGCFGVPSVFSFTSKVCGKCDHFSSCQKKAHAALIAHPQQHVVRSLLEKHNAYVHENEEEMPEGAVLSVSRPAPKSKRESQVRFALTPEQMLLLGSLPKKVADYLKKLMVRGLDRQILEAASKGENLFTQDKHRPYQLALDMLMEGGLTKPMLRAAYIEKLGWTERASSSQVSIVWSLFKAMNLAEEQGCSLVPSPSVLRKNSFIEK